MNVLEVGHVLADDEQVVLAFVNPLEPRDRLVAIGPEDAKGPSRRLARTHHGRSGRQIHAVVRARRRAWPSRGPSRSGDSFPAPRGCSRDAWDRQRPSAPPPRRRQTSRPAPARRLATPRPRTRPTTPPPAGARRSASRRLDGHEPDVRVMLLSLVCRSIQGPSSRWSPRRVPPRTARRRPRISRPTPLLPGTRGE